MLAREATIHLGLLQAQLLDAGFDGHFLFQQTLGLHGDVNGLRARLVIAHGGLSLFDLAANGRQLILHELQLGRGFGRAAIHILPNVGIGHVLDEGFGTQRIGILVGQLQDARFLALLRCLDVFLQLCNNVQAAETGHLELHPRVGTELVHLQSDSAALGGHANLTLQQLVAILIKQHEVLTAIAHSQHHGGVNERERHFKAMYAKYVATPAIARQAKLRRRHLIFGLGLEAADEEVAEHRKALGFNCNFQIQLVHGLTDDSTRRQQRDFGGGGRAAASTQRGEVSQAGDARHLRLHLHHRLSLVNRACEQRIGNTSNEERGSRSNDPPFAINKRPKQLTQIDFIILDRSRVHLLRHRFHFNSGTTAQVEAGLGRLHSTSNAAW